MKVVIQRVSEASCPAGHAGIPTPQRAHQSPKRCKGADSVCCSRKGAVSVPRFEKEDHPKANDRDVRYEARESYDNETAH